MAWVVSDYYKGGGINLAAGGLQGFIFAHEVIDFGDGGAC